MTPLPKISIMIPSYNKGDYIGKTLRSIFGQDYPNLEVIVKDGGSSDKTVSILKRFAKKYKNLNWVSKRDKGQLDAINEGFKEASGDVLAYINADDFYEKGSLNRVGEYFRKNPKTPWIAGKGRVVDAKDNEISKGVTAYKNLLLHLNKYPLLLMVNYLMQPSVFLSRGAFKQYGPFTGTKRYVLEYGLWLKIGRDVMPSVINKYLSSFRLTMDTISATSYKDVLARDTKIVKSYTDNRLLLLLHELNNFGRTILVKKAG